MEVDVTQLVEIVISDRDEQEAVDAILSCFNGVNSVVGIVANRFQATFALCIEEPLLLCTAPRR